jgi:crotonobetaine/carnitine-CoA ligase
MAACRIVWPNRNARVIPGGDIVLTPPESLLAFIEERSARDPHAPLIVEADGDTYSYGDAARLVHEWIAWFAQQRAVRPLRLGAILPNTAVTHLLRLAAAYAGVVFTSLNPMLSGKALMDALARSQVTDVVLPRRRNGCPVDANAVLSGRRDEFALHWCEAEHIEFVTAVVDPEAGPVPPPVRPCPTLVYTSGTSGPAKPVRLPAELMVTYGRLLFGDDVQHWQDGGYYSPWHPAHVLGAVALEAAVQRGLTLVLRERFDLEAFWTDVVEHNCHLTVLISVADSVWSNRDKAPAANPLDVVGVSPALRDYRSFEDCFGVKVVNIYGMTELGTVLTSSPKGDRTLTGRPSRHYLCRIAPFEDTPIDIYSRPLTKEHRVGELIVRPLGVTSSYEPGVDPTSSWRDGWFHTGDLFIESGGEYRFVGRVKDSIRRNGRNISAQDLEDEIRVLPGVDQCVCVGYCDAGTVEEASRDDEIRLFVVPETPGRLNAESLVASLRERLSLYMLPRYVDIVSDLPRTDNGKLSRHTLRQMPLTPKTFDRKADRRLDALSSSGRVRTG